MQTTNRKMYVRKCACSLRWPAIMQREVLLRKVKSIMSNGTNTSFGLLKQIDAGVLNVGYAETGPTDGRTVILLHGWPYHIHNYVNVAPLLVSAGYRGVVPDLPGFGSTHFL